MLKPEKARELLIEGNARFAENKQLNHNQCISRRNQIKERQNPFAVIFSCSDSRVPPEIIFDQGLGDLFVIRNAGQVLSEDVIGSMEYAVKYLNVKLIVVMSHDKCGAISAALKYKNSHESKHVQLLIEYIMKSYDDSIDEQNLVYDLTIKNSFTTVKNITKSSSIISEKLEEDKLKVIAAHYNFDTGLVKFFD